MADDEELVCLVDREGHAVGEARRSQVRGKNLLHAVTVVLVRDLAARVYAHQRSHRKDWAPGLWDLAAGGVVRPGEDVGESARRELAEELGISGTRLRPLGTHVFEDITTRCFQHAYSVQWDGPVRHQPEEVIEGGWLTMAEVAGLLARRDHGFVSDTLDLLRHLAEAGVEDYDQLF